MLDMMSQLPLVLYFVGGGIAAGAIGFLLGKLFKIDPRFAALPIIAGWLVVCVTVISPWIKKAQFGDTFAQMIGELPQKADEATTLVATAVEGDTAKLIFETTNPFQEGFDPVPAMKQAMVTPNTCSQFKLVSQYVTTLVFSYKTNIGVVEVPITAEDCP
jgi:hypothetical protein